MPKLLFIGSVTADVVVRVPELPMPGDDVHIISQHTALGGCAYNAYHAATLPGTSDCTLFSPVGTGVWGDWVRAALQQRGIVTPIPPVDDPSGCCYCLVTPDGERTFLCDHGAEYRFSPDWFDALEDCYDAVYVCGLEIEEPTGKVILSWLEQHPPRRLYFAPGPRIFRIPPHKMARMMALRPVFHLNEVEALQFTRTEDVAEAAALIRSLSLSDVVITLGEQGAYILTEHGGELIPGFPARVIDTIGAGDAHIGSMITAEAEGLPMKEAVRRANRIASAVVAQSGAELSLAKYNKAMEEYQ